MERHAASHKDFFNNMPKTPEAIKRLYEEKLKGLTDLSHKMSISLNRQQIVTLASYKLVQAMIKKQMPFMHGEFLKEAIIIAMDTLLTANKDKLSIISDINALQMSRRTVVRRLETMSEEVRKKIKYDLKKCLAFSICLDESTDVIDNSQLVVWVRYIDANLTAHEELLGLEVLLNTTKAVDIVAKLNECFEKLNIKFEDLVAVTTDGAAAMVGRIGGVQTLLSKTNPNLIKLQCIIHQEALCAKFGIESAKPFADFIMQIINKVI